MIYLGAYKVGAAVSYALYFHDDNGALCTPTDLSARLRSPAGVWSDEAAPAQMDAQTGLYGGSVAAPATAGLYLLAVKGTVPTAKAVGCIVAFHAIANTEDDIVSMLGAAEVAVSAPVAASGDVSIVAGDDYTAAHSRALSWAFTTPSLTGATVALKAGSLTKACGVVGQAVTAELTAAETGAIGARRVPYELEALWSDGQKATIARGTIDARAD